MAEFTLETVGVAAVDDKAAPAAAPAQAVADDDFDADTRIGFTLTDNERAEGGLPVLEAEADDVFDTQSDAAAHTNDAADHATHEAVVHAETAD